MDELTQTRTMALAWANVVRGRYSLGEPRDALPVADRHGACACPLALAIGGQCAVLHCELILYYNDTETEDVSIGLPAVVAEFVRAFDAGLYPDLIA